MRVTYAPLIETLAADLGQPLEKSARKSLAAFAELVHTWNKKMNLTAAREPVALVEVLFADALMLATEGPIAPDSKVLDVGSGAGAPAIPLALLRPDIALTLVEPLHKRVAFMRHAIGTLGLAGRVTVIERKLEPEDGPLPGAPFDVAMSRATVAPAAWLALGLVQAPRVLVLTAAEEPPASDVTEVALELRYAAPSSGAPRVITAHVASSAF